MFGSMQSALDIADMIRNRHDVIVMTARSASFPLLVDVLEAHDFPLMDQPVTTNAEALRVNHERASIMSVMPSGQRRLDGRRRRR